MPILAERRILTGADLGSRENYRTTMGQVRQLEHHLQEHGHLLGVEGPWKPNRAVVARSDATIPARLLGAEPGPTPVRETAFDPINGWHIIASLKDGFPVVEFRRRWVSTAPAVKELERAILAGGFRHEANPILRWNFGTIQLHVDQAGNRSFHKGKSANEIDGAVACAMRAACCVFGEGQSATAAPWFEGDMWTV